PCLKRTRPGNPALQLRGIAWTARSGALQARVRSGLWAAHDSGANLSSSPPADLAIARANRAPRVCPVGPLSRITDESAGLALMGSSSDPRPGCLAELAGRRLLVTGATGFVGQHAVRALLSTGEIRVR